MKSLLITASAYNTIITVSHRCLLETGGVLMGVLGNPLVIVGAGQPGANAIHHFIRFTTDPASDIECLSTWRQVYGLVIEIVGWYHKHHHLQEPSSGDHNQVRQLREDFKDSRPILMGIVSENGLFRKNLKLRFFSLDDTGNQIEYDWEIISDDSTQIQQAIQSLPHRPQLKDSGFWDDPHFQFYQNPIFRKRICREIGQLKESGLCVCVCRNKSDGNMVLQIANNNMCLKLLMPPEYPLNPPIVFAGQKNIFDLRTITHWNSMMTLPCLVNEAIATASSSLTTTVSK